MIRAVQILLCLALLALGGAMVHPFGPVRQTSPAPLFAGAEMDEASRALFERACANCHSERVQWPWYSHVAPVSWMIERDVDQARAQLNASRWPRYDPQARITALSAMAVVLRTGAMPPRRYAAVHPEAELTEGERGTLQRWAKAERARVRRLTGTEQPGVTPNGSPTIQKAKGD